MTKTQSLKNAFAAAACILLVLAGLASTACTVDAERPLFIIQNQVPNIDCTIPADKGTLFRASGVIDTGGQQNYVFTPLVESRADPVDESDPLQRAIIIEGATVNLIIPDGAADIGALENLGAINFTKRFSTVLEPSGLKAFAFTIVPAAVTASIQNSLTGLNTVEVLAEIEVFGTLGNRDVQSPKFTYPVSVCAGCRIAAPTCVGYESPSDVSCFPGQDSFPIECCQSSLGELQCPPVVEPVPMN